MVEGVVEGYTVICVNVSLTYLPLVDVQCHVQHGHLGRAWGHRHVHGLSDCGGVGEWPAPNQFHFLVSYIPRS